MGLGSLCHLEHRGASGAEVNTGDGAGILIQIPDAFYRAVAGFDAARPRAPTPPGSPSCRPTPTRRPGPRQGIEKLARRRGPAVLGWREVPIDDSLLGSIARSAMPSLPPGVRRRAAATRGLSTAWTWSDGPSSCASGSSTSYRGIYFPSLSARTVVYKGMLTAPQVEVVLPRPGRRAVDSALALVHSRFSTNTFPSWPLAHPYRYLAHNGEINTLQGNRNWMRAREALLRQRPPPRRPRADLPDHHARRQRLGQLRRGPRAAAPGRPPAAPRRAHDDPGGLGEPPAMDPARRAFYQFHASIMEPWDGPASIAFTDGTVIGAVLDRNGLRPSRYWVTDDGLVVMASEVGVLDIDPRQVVQRGRLQPGRMFLVDTVAGPDRRPTRRSSPRWPPSTRTPTGWPTSRSTSTTSPPRFTLTPQHASIITHQRLFGYTTEDLKVLLAPMARTGAEPLGSMGTDTPVAVLSERPRLLYDYFQQLFAQVTNPPLDAIREELVTSLAGTIGPERNLLAPEPGQLPPDRHAPAHHHQRGAGQAAVHQRGRRPSRAGGRSPSTGCSRPGRRQPGRGARSRPSTTSAPG